MADFLAGLENMASNVVEATGNDGGDQTDHTTVQRWQKLFDFSRSQATEQIQLHRNNTGRSRVSDDLWSIAKSEQEALGSDREAYEYALTHGSSLEKATRSTTLNHISRSTVYIVKLDRPLTSAEKIQFIASLTTIPSIAKGTGETGTATFCQIDGSTRQKILEWVAQEHPIYRPTIVRLSKSPKQLSPDTLAPVLGHDTTLPHHRPDSEIRSWRGKYRALVDADAQNCEEGSAYLVRSREQEDVLRFYETEKYEVVRCVLDMEGGTVNGLVFRFAGTEEELGD